MVVDSNILDQAPGHVTNDDSAEDAESIQVIYNPQTSKFAAIMGNIIPHMVGVTYSWPPNYADKKHWCYEAGSNPDHYAHYCDDPDIGSPQFDADFDYSAFRCQEAKCQTCLDLNPKLYPARELWLGTSVMPVDAQSQEIHVTSKSLLESTSRGCQTCSVLKEGIELVGGSQTLVPNFVLCIEILNGFTVRVTHEAGKKSAAGEERLAIEFHRGVGDFTQLAWSVFGTARRVTTNVGVKSCVEFVHSSIKECLKHPKCMQNHSPNSRSKLPTRLIDVGVGEDDVKLETSPKAMERYIALSHAWGTLNLLTTTTTNLQSHCENIPWTLLSRTFQDAISVTWGLGIRYIWIDSLCIIQDSPSDWETEAADMKYVYSNSYLTIAATSAADGSEGLLRPRYNLGENTSPEYLCEYEIKRSDTLASHSIYARRVIKYSHKFLLSLEYKGGHKELAPFLYRAWVLQERILSPRILHFSFDEMVWECTTGIDCECGFAASPSGRALSVGPLGFNVFKELFNNSQSPSLQIIDEARKADYEKKLFSAWYRLAEYYMALSITFPADRVSALRGIAGSLEEKLGWTFLEGVWVEDVVSGLLWYGSWLHSYRKTKSVPSWSWASMEPNDSASWDKEAISVPSVYDVLHFVNSQNTINVHEMFRLITHSSRPHLQLDGTSYNNMVPGDRAYIVVEAIFINATTVVKRTSPTEPQAPKTETTSSEDCNSELTREEAKGPEVGDDKPKTEEDKHLALSVRGRKMLIDVMWDIGNNNSGNSMNRCGEVAENDEVAAILLGRKVVDDMETGSVSSGLVLKKAFSGDLDLYERVGYFSFTREEEEEYSTEIATRQVILI